MTGTNKVIGILLAAGAGTRFGGDKGLARLPDGMPMAVRSAQNLSAIVDEVWCVVHPKDVGLQDVLKTASLSTVTCHNAEEGMAASLRTGVAARVKARGWVIALADMPVIQQETYLKLAARLSDQHIVMPEHQRQPGHPVWFPQRYREDLLALKGDQGAKVIVRQYADQVRRFDVSDAGVLQDFDTQESFTDYFNSEGSKPQD